MSQEAVTAAPGRGVGGRVAGEREPKVAPAAPSASAGPPLGPTGRRRERHSWSLLVPGSSLPRGARGWERGRGRAPTGTFGPGRGNPPASRTPPRPAGELGEVLIG